MASKRIQLSSHLVASSPYATPSFFRCFSVEAFLMICKRNAKSVLHAMKQSSIFRPQVYLASVTVLGAILVPSIARFVVPLLRPTFLVLVPQFWSSLLRWLTPSCLFLLLNCIIVILTATSGFLKNTGAGSSEFYTEFIVKMENRQKHYIVAAPLKKHAFQDPNHPSVEEQLAHEFGAKMSTVEKQLIKETSVTEKAFQANFNDSAASGLHARRKTERVVSEPENSYARLVRRSDSVDSSRSTGVERSLSSSNLIVVALSDEELKSRIENFIAKFNAQIRQESLQRR